MNQQMVQMETQTETTSLLPVSRGSEGMEMVAGHPPEISTQDSEPEVAEQLLWHYEVETKRRRKRVQRAIQIGGVAAIGMALANVAAFLVVIGTNAAFSLEIALGLLLLGGLLILGCAVVAIDAGYSQRRCRSRFVSTAREHGYVSIVGPLIEMLDQPKTRLSAAESLVELLPRLDAKSVRLLKHEQLQRLCDVLRNGARGDHQLRIAILRAFAQIGDISVLTQVERIADSPARNWRQRELKEEAQKCLPLLRARTQHETASRTLLRAASAAASAPDALLRPAAAVSLSGPDHLLRPTEARV